MESGRDDAIGIVGHVCTAEGSEGFSRMTTECEKGRGGMRMIAENAKSAASNFKFTHHRGRE